MTVTLCLVTTVGPVRVAESDGDPSTLRLTNTAGARVPLVWRVEFKPEAGHAR